MALFAIIAVLLGLYFSWRTIRLLRAIAKELQVQEENGIEKKWFKAVKEALKNKVYKDAKD